MVGLEPVGKNSLTLYFGFQPRAQYSMARSAPLPVVQFCQGHFLSSLLSSPRGRGNVWSGTCRVTCRPRFLQGLLCSACWGKGGSLSFSCCALLAGFQLTQSLSPAAGPGQGAKGTGQSRFSCRVRGAAPGRCLCAAQWLPARVGRVQWLQARCSVTGEGSHSQEDLQPLG